MPLAIPARNLVVGEQGDVLSIGISGEDIVQAKGLVNKVVTKILGDKAIGQEKEYSQQ